MERQVGGRSRRRSFDLFGFIDVLGINAGGTLAVQATTSDHLAARVKKILESPNLPLVASTPGWTIEAWGWRNYATKGWMPRVVRFCFCQEGGLYVPLEA